MAQSIAGSGRATPPPTPPPMSTTSSSSPLSTPPPSSPALSSSPCCPTIELCSSADVTLLLGEKQQPVRVSVTTLRNASPAWAAMFSGSWAESDTSEMAFPDDNVEAMLLVLRIAHLRFNEIPKKNGLSFQLLLDVAIICDKYDLVHLVRPFLDLHEWAAPYSYPKYTGPGYPAWLLIAWTFGYGDSFDSLARHLPLYTRVRSMEWPYKKVQHKSAEVNGEEIKQNTLPPGIFESILQVRHDALAEGLEVVYKKLVKIFENTKCLARTEDNQPIDVSECRATMLGTLLPQLISNSLYPNRMQATSCTWSVNHLHQMVRSIKPAAHKSYDFKKMAEYVTFSPAPKIPQGKGLISHSRCAALLYCDAEIDDVVDRMPSPTLESHIRHMEEQAKK